MSKFLLVLMSVFVVLVAGCAGNGGTMAAVTDNGGLPEIAPYDEAAIDLLPDMVAAE